MEKCNGLKVIGFREEVDGNVVEVDYDAKFKIVKYYHNEYNTYLSEEVATFEIIPSNDVNELLKNFKKELRKYVSLRNTYIQENVYTLLTVPMCNIE